MDRQELTEEELKLIYQVLAAGKWDLTYSSFVSFLPAAIVVGVGISNLDPLWITIGIGIHLFLRIYQVISQDLAMPPFQTGIGKLLKNNGMNPDKKD